MLIAVPACYASCIHVQPWFTIDGSAGLLGTRIGFTGPTDALFLIATFLIGPLLFAILSPAESVLRLKPWFRFLRLYIALTYGWQTLTMVLLGQKAGPAIVLVGTLLVFFLLPEIYELLRWKFPPGFFSRAQCVPREQFSSFTRITAFTITFVAFLIGLIAFLAMMLDAIGGNAIPTDRVGETLLFLGMLLFVLIGAYLPARALFSWMGWKFVDDQIPRCPNCYYNLTGNVSGKCPECGMQIELSGLQ